MKTYLTDVEIVGFLQDYEKNSETIILEEGKEKKELIKIAEARGIQIKGSKDLAVFKTIYAFTDKPNANGAILPKKELLRVLPQLVGKPIDINHNRRFVVGHYIDYRYRDKENQAVAYGVYYKSNFPDEFEQAKKLFKKKKLSSSFEIWSPEGKRKARKDGSYELHQLEIAGGALIYEDKDNQPAFKDAKVLDFAKESEQSKLELVYASKYKENEIIVCKDGKCDLEVAESFGCECIKCGYKMQSDKHCNIIKCPKCQGDMRRADRPGTGRPDLSPNANSGIKCSNCGEEFEYGSMGEVKCPKCFAILNKTGQMIYPPQIHDFKILCPSCKVQQWLIVSKIEDGAKVRCLHCSKEYNITFSKIQKNPILDKIDFVYIGKVNCYQCGKTIPYSGVSSIKERSFKCKSCELEFTYNLAESERYKKIGKIVEIKVEKSSKQGGITMAKEKKVDKASEQKSEEQKKLDADLKMLKEKGLEPVKAFVVEKTEVTKATKEQPEVKAKKEGQEAPKVEDKVEEPKVEKVEDIEGKAKKADELFKEKLEKEKAEKAEAKKVEDEKLKKAEDEKIKKVEDEKLATAKLIEKYKAGIRKLAKKYKGMKKSMLEKIEFYKVNAGEIDKRRDELEDFAVELSDNDILNDEKFAQAKANKENASIKKASIVGNKNDDKNKDKDYYDKRRKEIDDIAFGRKNK